ncbi:MAG: glycosyltransferase family 4 protein, partial [Beijerinckiaceae bacterium]
GMGWTMGALGFRHIFVGGPTLRRGDANGTDYYFSPMLLYHLARIRPDAIICAGFSLPTMYAALYARITGARLLIYSDGTNFSERNYGRGQMRARQALIPRASALIAKSSLAAERFQTLGGGSKTFIAHHTTDLDRFLNVGRSRTYTAQAQLRLLCVGRLIARKGVHHLLAALATMPPTTRPVHLTLVGSGPEEAALKAYCRQHRLDTVTFAGFADQAALPQYYADSDVFVLPTLQDPFGIVVLEAAASGIAILSSVYAGATSEFVIDGRTGFTFEPADESRLAALIATLANAPDQATAMGRAAHDLAASRTPDHTADDYLKAIRYALQS